MYLNTSIGKIFYIKVGHGPHLSFLHGFCEHSGIWDKLIPELSKHYTCLLIDLPGFGNSKSIPIPSVYDQGKLVIEIHKKLNHLQTVLLGHSMGGYVALEVLEQNPDILKGLGLIHSIASSDRSETVEKRIKANEHLEHHEKTNFLKSFIKNLVTKDLFLRLKDELWNQVKETPKSSIIQGNKIMIKRKDHQNTLARSQLPLLFICGEYDTFFEYKEVFKQASQCQIASINLIPEVAHLSMLESPKIILKFIKRFAHQWNTSKLSS